MELYQLPPLLPPPSPSPCITSNCTVREGVDRKTGRRGRRQGAYWRMTEESRWEQGVYCPLNHKGLEEGELGGRQGAYWRTMGGRKGGGKQDSTAL
jgi:hypothetical protein